VMVPDRHDSHYIVTHSYEEVEDEEEEVPVVLQTKAIVNPSYIL
jgi:hypothetical protein